MIKTIKKLSDLLTPRERRRAVLVFAMMVVAAFVEVVGVASVMPFVAVLTDTSMVHENAYLATAYDFLGFDNTREFVILLGAALLIVFVSSLAFRALTLYAIQRFATLRIHSIAVRLLKVYLSQPYEAMLQKNTASLAKSVLAEVGNVANGVLLPGMRAMSGAIVAFSIVLLLIAVEPVISIVLAGGLSLSYCAIYLLTRPLFARAGWARLRANDARFVFAGEALQGFKELRVLGREQAYLDRFYPSSKEFARRQAQTLIVRELPYFLVQGIAFGGVLALLLFLVAGGEPLGRVLPLVTFYAFAGYRMLPAFQDIYRSLGQVRFALPALDELYSDLVRAPHGVPSVGAKQKRLTLVDCIRFESVGFKYDAAGGAAVSELDFEIEQGSCVAFVGHTGAGKSTTVDLLLGLLRPSEGRILIDGRPLDLDVLRAWQANLGYVPQSIFLSDDTVAANIAFGVPRERVDMAEVMRAAEQARIHDFVGELPHGYDTRIGERGARLSGGQRQRLGIARALYHDPQVIVFDEATSALDNQTEAQVMEALTALHGQKTVVLIAHRISTVARCDRIFLLADGKLSARGTYDELLQHDSAFKALAAVS